MENINVEKTQLIYLASPYSNPDDIIRILNYQNISKVAAQLISEGHVVFSPISYGHHLLKFKDMPTDWGFWNNFCVTFLLKCDKLIVCKMRGWDKSIGVQAEIDIANKNNIPVEFIDFKIDNL